MRSHPAVAEVAAAVAGVLTIVTVFGLPSMALSVAPRHRQPASTSQGAAAAAAFGSPAGTCTRSHPLGWAQRESGWASTSGTKCRDRAIGQVAGLLMSAGGGDQHQDGGGEGNALLLRMDFEHGEVQELREWIRR